MIDGTHSLFIGAAPILGLTDLALALTAVAAFRLAGLLGWRGYGRLGRAGAGLAFGAATMAALGLARLGVTLPAADPLAADPLAADPLAWEVWRDSAYLMAPFLLPLLAALRLDALMGRLAAIAMALLSVPVLGWPGCGLALLSALTATLAPAAFRRWPSLRDDRSFACLGYLPSLLLIPAAFTGTPLAMALSVLAVLLQGPALFGMSRLLAQDLREATEKPAVGNEEELKAAPLISRTIADLPEGVAVFDAADRLVACNATYRRLNALISDLLVIGTTYADLVRAAVLRGQSRQETSVPDPEAAIADHLARHRQLPWRVEVPGPDERTLLVIESKTAEGGTLRLMTDVTAIKGREMRLTELAQRNEVLATVVGAVSSGIVICDATRPDHPVTFVNAAFTRMTGYRPEEMIGRNCRILQGRDTDPEALERLRRALVQHRAITVTLRNYRKDGRTFWNELAISPIYDEQGRLLQFVGIMSDVTQRIRAEENLREAKNQAELANRAKSEFLANVSHELRTPLNAIIGFSDVMKMELFGPLGTPRYQDYTKDIFDSGKMLLSLINDILDLSKIEAGKMELHPEPVPVAEVFDSAMTLMRERAKNGGVTLRAEVAPDLPPLFADLRVTKQIVTNLVSNAVKFTPKDGTVELIARRLDGSQAEILVKDTGIGIAKDDIAEVLKPFVQVDGALQRRQSGTGLGLPIVKSLTDLSGGSFHLDSEVGRGTVVTLHLPLCTDKEARSAAE
ncbi:PAS domain-containing sensor histidine kinase [Dongia sp.]|uniref:PAS domain-containing sensor histidine kinase n=1 Tax=Dongia sp. TaxID=1977262 RepID=UPI0035AE3B75